MKTAKFVGMLVLVAMIASLLAGCGGAKGTLKIAIIAPMTGDVATFGEMTRDGVVLALEEWNAKGGVLGKKIEWIVADGRCDAQEARNAANKVIDQDKVKFIIGEVCSSASIPIGEVSNPKKVIQISGTSTNPKVTTYDDGSVKPYSFRACFIDPFQGTVMGNFALKTLGAKTAAVLLDQGNDYVRGLAEYFKAAYEAGGGKIVVWETYTKDDSDFSAILAKVADAKPDFLFLPDYYNKVNLIAKQAKEKGITCPMGGGDGWDSAELDRAAVDGGFYSNHYFPGDTRPIVVSWLKTFGAKYNGKVPDALATLAYDATNMLLQAIKNAGSEDPDKVKAALEAISFEGVSGKIKLDKVHNPIKSAVVIGVKDGELFYKTTVNP